MPDLTELQRLAEGATPCDGWYVLKHGHGSDVRGRHVTGGSTWIAECRTDAEAAYIAAMNPDTAKKLIAVALAAEMLYADTLDYIRVNNLGDPNNYGMRAVHTALEELK